MWRIDSISVLIEQPLLVFKKTAGFAGGFLDGFLFSSKDDKILTHMIAKIIPKVKLPRQFTAFDYLVPCELEDEIKIGQIVEVEFRRKKIEGLVSEIKNNAKEQEKIIPNGQWLVASDKKLKLKPIVKILTEKPVLYSEQMRVLKWISEYYLAPMSLIYKTFVPDVTKKIIGPKNKKTNEQTGSLKLAVLKSRLPVIKKAISEIIGSPKNTLFFWSDLREKILVYIKLIEHYSKKKQQILILLPQITDIEFLSGYLRPHFGAKMAKLHAKLAKTQHYKNWLEIHSGRTLVILGTRSSILAPMKNPGLIIIDDEQAPDHKQSDQNPRYDARTIAEQFKTKKVFASASPRVESYYKTKTKELARVDLPTVFYGSSTSRVSNIPRLIDMNQEFQKGNYTPISDALKDAIKQALNQNQKTFLFLNRKGQARMIVCRDCQFLFQCPKCQLPLTHHEIEKQLICHQCNSKIPAPAGCLKCQGQNLKFVGTGTQKIEKEIKKEFPNSKVIRIDKGTHYYQLDIEKYDIIVGTQFFLQNFFALENVGLVGIISADTLLYRPEFKAGEKTYDLITKILTWARFNKSGQILAQTYLKNQLIILNALAQNFANFYQNEIKARQQLGYPPFVKLIKLIHKDLNENQGLRKTLSLVYKLKRLEGVCVLGPLIPNVPKVGKNCIHQIIIKTSANSYPNIQALLKSLIPNDFLIDIEASDLL